MKTMKVHSSKKCIQKIPQRGLPCRALLISVIACCAAEISAAGFREGAYHVHPGEQIQPALDKAAEDVEHKRVIVHQGTYFPSEKRQALIWFNERHDGIELIAEGEVVLSAANSAIADPSAESFPAVVNHVVYFGDGVSGRTTLRGFKITGANNYVTDRETEDVMEPNFDSLRHTEGYYGRLFFYSDGGGIKVFGNSSPTIERVEIFDCYSSPCGGGISIEQRGFKEQPVTIRDCVFRDNRALVTGAAVDLLPGSFARIENCLFVGNVSNTGVRHKPVVGNIDWPEIPRLMASAIGYLPNHGSGALTVFFNSRVDVQRSTFTGNFNGVDDMGDGSNYSDCIFWMNTATGGIRPAARYELNLKTGEGVRGSFVNGEIDDLRSTVDGERNELSCPDPKFDEAYIPANQAFRDVGYRPAVVQASGR